MSTDYPGQGTRFGDFIERLNTRLRPYLSGAQLGEPGEAPVPLQPHGGLCPICSARMDEHVVDRTGERTMLYCPEPSPEPQP
ncbi:MAG: hypothetical protein H7146_14135 [Burkholderiaceae bacterium]|nr:hypothetical protein [Microbacteriaceae bacterium]